MKKWETISSEPVLNNKWFNVYKDTVKCSNEKIVDDFFIWKDKNVSFVVALTSENKVLLIRQYTYAYGEFLTGLPAGYCEEGENPEQAAERELLEETGYKGGKITFLGECTNHPTKVKGSIFVFLIEDVKKVASPSFEETEEIETVEVPFDEAIEMIYKGEIIVTGSISALVLAYNKLRKLNKLTKNL